MSGFCLYVYIVYFASDKVFIKEFYYYYYIGHSGWAPLPLKFYLLILCMFVYFGRKQTDRIRDGPGMDPGMDLFGMNDD